MSIRIPRRPPLTVSAFRGEQAIVPVTDLATDAEALTITGSADAPGWVADRTGSRRDRPERGRGTRLVWLDGDGDRPGWTRHGRGVTSIVENRPPVAVEDTVDVSSGGPASFQIVDNDTDADSAGGSEALVIQSISSTEIVFTNGATGTVTVGPLGRSVRVDSM